MVFALSKLKGVNMKRESIIQRLLMCAPLILVVLVSGCFSIGPTVRTYGENKLQKSEVAVIKGWWMFILLGYEGVDIYSVDGNELRATKVEVLPGWHKLMIRAYGFSFIAMAAPPQYTGVYHNFEAGHRYKIRYWYKGILIEGIKIIDVTTGAIIQESSLFP